MFYKIGLNNKGMSAVEVLITFTLVAVISVSLLNVVMTYKDREETESYKQEIITYKNNITKMIEDDATKYVIKSVKRKPDKTGDLCEYDNNDPQTQEELKHTSPVVNVISYEIKFVLTSEVKTLTVDKLNNTITYTENEKDVNYPLPDLGTSKFERVGKLRCKNIKALRISDMNIKEENNFFIIDINLYHNKVKLQNKYGIHISVPINFT